MSDILKNKDIKKMSKIDNLLELFDYIVEKSGYCKNTDKNEDPLFWMRKILEKYNNYEINTNWEFYNFIKYSREFKYEKMKNFIELSSDERILELFDKFYNKKIFTTLIEYLKKIFEKEIEGDEERKEENNKIEWEEETPITTTFIDPIFEGEEYSEAEEERKEEKEEEEDLIDKIASNLNIYNFKKTSNENEIEWEEETPITTTFIDPIFEGEEYSEAEEERKEEKEEDLLDKIVGGLDIDNFEEVLDAAHKLVDSGYFGNNENDKNDYNESIDNFKKMLNENEGEELEEEEEEEEEQQEKQLYWC